MDYPLFRKHLGKYRGKFNKVILYPSDHNREVSFKDFLFETVKEDWVKDHKIDWFTDPPPDWRQEEAMAMLPFAKSEWIYFTEQDFFIKDPDKFYSKVKEAMDRGADAIGFMNPTAFPYLHPACFFIKREILEKTSKDFRAHPEIPGADHFSMITRDLEKLGAKIVTTEEMGFQYWQDCFHLGGLTSNMIDSVVNPDFEFHRPEIFHVYLHFALDRIVAERIDGVDVELIDQLNLEDFFEQVRVRLLMKHPELVDVNPHESEWAAFFKNV